MNYVNNSNKTNSKIIISLTIIIFAIAITLIMLFKFGVISFNKQEKNVPQTLNSEQTTTVVESGTAVQVNSENINPMDYIDKTFNDIRSKFGTYKGFNTEMYDGVFKVSFWADDNTLMPIGFLFLSHEGFLEDWNQKIIGYATDTDGTEFYKGVCVGDSYEKFKSVVGNKDEIFFSEENLIYCVSKIPLENDLFATLKFSDSEGSKIVNAEVAKINY